MDWIIFILLILSFFVVYQSNKTNFYIYSILFPLVGFFLFNKIGYRLAYTVINAELIAFILMAIWQGRYKEHKKFLSVYLCVFLLYFFFISVHQHVSFLVRWNDYKSPLIFFLWGTMLFDDIKRNNVSVLRLRRFFISFLIFELSLSSLQYLFEPIRVFFRDVGYIGIDGEIKEVRDELSAGFMVGTFTNGTMLANLLSLCLVICTTYFASRNLLNKKSLIIIASTLFVIMLTGIRASLLFSLILLMLLMIKYKQKNLLYIALFFAAVTMIAGGIGFGSTEKVGFDSGGIARSLSVFNSFSGDYLKEGTTLAMTFGILPYIVQNPLFGIGLHYKGGYALANTNFYLEDYSFSDAMLSFELAEIGIIGVLIYLWPLLMFMRITNRNNKDKSQFLFVFVLLVLSTILDSGFMSNFNLFLFYFSVVFFMGSPSTL